MIALGIIYDMARAKLEHMPRPDVPKPPLYDGRLAKGRDGFVWMSEMTLRDLEWWAGTKQKSVDNGGQYAEKDAKTVATLQKWIAWRTLYPSEVWSGKRGDERVSAAPPSRDPQVHAWGPRNDARKPQSAPRSRDPEPPRDDEGEGYGF